MPDDLDDLLSTHDSDLDDLLSPAGQSSTPTYKPIVSGAAQSFQTGARETFGMPLLAAPALAEAVVRRFVGPQPTAEDPTPLGNYLRLRNDVEQAQARAQEYDRRPGASGFAQDALDTTAGSIPAMIPSMGAGMVAKQAVNLAPRVASVLPDAMRTRMVPAAQAAGITTFTQDAQSGPAPTSITEGAQKIASAVTQGLIEGAFTFLGGRTGVEAILHQKGLPGLKEALKAFGGGALNELPEEGLTSFTQTFAKQVEEGRLDANDLAYQTALGSVAGFAMGGAVHAPGVVQAGGQALMQPILDARAQRQGDQQAANTAALNAMDPSRAQLRMETENPAGQVVPRSEPAPTSSEPTPTVPPESTTLKAANATVQPSPQAQGDAVPNEGTGRGRAGLPLPEVRLGSPDVSVRPGDAGAPAGRGVVGNGPDGGTAGNASGVDPTDYATLKHTPEQEKSAQDNSDVVPTPPGAPAAVGPSPIHGRGVLATKPLQAGEIVGPAALGENRTEIGRFLNHGGQTANATLQDNGDRLDVVVTKPVRQGEELTLDYQQIEKAREGYAKRLQQGASDVKAATVAPVVAPGAAPGSAPAPTGASAPQAAVPPVQAPSVAQKPQVKPPVAVTEESSSTGLQVGQRVRFTKGKFKGTEGIIASLAEGGRPILTLDSGKKLGAKGGITPENLEVVDAGRNERIAGTANPGASVTSGAVASPEAGASDARAAVQTGPPDGVALPTSVRTQRGAVASSTPVEPAPRETKSVVSREPAVDETQPTKTEDSHGNVHVSRSESLHEDGRDGDHPGERTEAGIPTGDLSAKGREEQKIAGETPGQDEVIRKLLSGQGGTLEPGQRVSNLIEGLVTGDLAAIPILRGAKVVNDTDAAILLATIRSPFIERLGWLLIRDGSVIHNGVWSIGTIDESVPPTSDELRSLSNELNVRPGDSWVWAHNHPSGNTTPSSADISEYGKLRSVIESLGAKFSGLVLNGDNFSLIGSNKTMTLPYKAVNYRKPIVGASIKTPIHAAEMFKSFSAAPVGSVAIHLDPYERVVGLEMFNRVPRQADVAQSRMAVGATTSLVVSTNHSVLKLPYDDRVTDAIHLKNDGSVISSPEQATRTKSREDLTMRGKVNVFREGGDTKPPEADTAGDGKPFGRPDLAGFGEKGSEARRQTNITDEALKAIPRQGKSDAESRADADVKMQDQKEVARVADMLLRSMPLLVASDVMMANEIIAKANANDEHKASVLQAMMRFEGSRMSDAFRARRDRWMTPDMRAAEAIVDASLAPWGEVASRFDYLTNNLFKHNDTAEKADEAVDGARDELIKDLQEQADKKDEAAQRKIKDLKERLEKIKGDMKELEQFNADLIQVAKNDFNTATKKLEQAIAEQEAAQKLRQDVLKQLDEMRDKMQAQRDEIKKALIREGMSLGALLNHFRGGMRMTPAEVAHAYGTLLRARGDSWGSVRHAYWVNWGLLSGPATGVANAVSGALYGSYKTLIEPFMAGLVRAGATPEARASLAAGARAWKSMFDAGVWQQAARTFAMTWRIGLPMNEAMSTYGTRDENELISKYIANQEKLTGKRLSFLEAEEVKMNIGGKGWRKALVAPGRFLGSADQFLQTLWAYAQVATAAEQIAIDNKTPENERPDMIAAMVADPGSKAWAVASQFSAKNAFNDEPSQVAKTILTLRSVEVPNLLPWRNAVSRVMPQRVPHRPVFYFAPFVSTPDRLFVRMVGLTPAGALAVAYRAAQRAQMPADQRTQEQSDEIWRGVGTQALVWGFTGMLAASIMGRGDDDEPWITGTNKIIAAGKEYPAYSMRIWGEWRSYKRLDPMAGAVSLVVDQLERQRAGDKHEGNIVTDTVSSISNTLLDKSYTQGLKDAFDLASQRKNFGAWMADFASSWSPALGRSLGRAAYPENVRTRVVADNEADWWGKVGQRALEGVWAGAGSPGVDYQGRAGGAGAWDEASSNMLERWVSPIATRSADVTAPAKWLRQWNDANPDEQYQPKPMDPWIMHDGKRVFLSQDEAVSMAQEAGSIAAPKLERLSRLSVTPGRLKAFKRIVLRSRRVARARALRRRSLGKLRKPSMK